MLKRAEDLLKPDLRFRNTVGGITGDGRTRHMAITDLHEEMLPLELLAEVPPVIREQFDRARHAFIHSWFVYDLVPLAEQQGYQALEMALREKLPPGEQQKAKERRWTL